MATETRIGRRLDAARAAMRRTAVELMEEARNTPAPCGCTPKARCDRHCRVKIQSIGRNIFGQLIWLATCNGPDDPKAAAYWIDLPDLYAWATDHANKHRTAAALDRAHNHGQRST